MKRITVIAAMLMLGLSACSMQDITDFSKSTMGATLDALSGPAGGITITKTQATATVPFDVKPFTINPERMTWNNEQLAPTTIEYGWEVMVPKSSETNAFGLLYWQKAKALNAIVIRGEKGPQTGTLEKFVSRKNSEFTGIWQVEGQQRQQLRIGNGGLDGRISANYSKMDKHLTFMLYGEELISYLFAEHPQKVQVRLTMPSGRPGEIAYKSFELPVKYW